MTNHSRRRFINKLFGGTVGASALPVFSFPPKEKSRTSKNSLPVLNEFDICVLGGSCTGVLIAIGLFEVDGGASVKPAYEITSPVFDKITIHLNNDYYPGNSFIIETENNSSENIYIQKAYLNGEAWKSFRFPP